MIQRENYFDVLAYLDYHERVLQSDPKTIKRKWGHLRHLLEWADDVLLPKAKKIESTFPRYLLTARNDGKGGALSPASMQRTCLEVRSFFVWAKVNRGQKYRVVAQSWIDTIRPAKANSLHSEIVEREYYSLAEIRALVDFIPKRLIDKRDRAAVAFVFLSAVRVGALVSLPVRCVDIENKTIEQLPSEGVRTKNKKAARTYLLPIEDLLQIAADWHQLVNSELGQDSLWYPNLATDGADWNRSDLVGNSEARRMSFARGLKRLCKAAGVPYRSPHKIRNGHGVFGIKATKTIEDFKAFSQNMMHESMDITDRLYGRLKGEEVKQVVLGLDYGASVEPSELKEFKQFQAFKEWQRRGGK